VEWNGILLGLAPAPERPPEPEERRGGFLSRLRENLRRSSRALAQGLNELAFDPNDDGPNQCTPSAPGAAKPTSPAAATASRRGR